jgi:hypothetical protein
MNAIEVLTSFHDILSTPPGGICEYLYPEDLAAIMV